MSLRIVVHEYSAAIAMLRNYLPDSDLPKKSLNRLSKRRPTFANRNFHSLVVFTFGELIPLMNYWATRLNERVPLEDIRVRWSFCDTSRSEKQKTQNGSASGF